MGNACDCRRQTDTRFGRKTKIVCVGDSITEGCGTTEALSYPGILQSRLDKKRFEVVNLGASGHTMRKNGDVSYWNHERY